MTIIAFIIIGILLLLFFSPSTVRAAFMGAPFVPTPGYIIRKGLKAAGLQAGETLYDLGSGTGKVLVIAEKEFGAKPVGFEYSTPLFFLSKINLFLRGAKNSKVLRKNFFDADLSKADVIFMFLTPKAFKKLEDKFRRELKPGVRVIAYSSPLLFWQPKEIISLPERGKDINLYLYFI